MYAQSYGRTKPKCRKPSLLIRFLYKVGLPIFSREISNLIHKNKAKSQILRDKTMDDICCTPTIATNPTNPFLELNYWLESFDAECLNIKN